MHLSFLLFKKEKKGQSLVFLFLREFAGNSTRGKDARLVQRGTQTHTRPTGQLKAAVWAVALGTSQVKARSLQ